MTHPGDDASEPIAGPTRRFILLCAPDTAGHGAPPELLSKAIAAREAGIVVRQSPYQAMADLVEHERAHRTGAHPGPLVLIVVEPTRFPGAADLVDAASRFSPRAVCWRFSASDDPQLAAYVSDAPSEPTTPPGPVHVRPSVADTIRPRPTQSQRPRLRLAGDPGNVSHNEGEPPEDGQAGVDEQHRPTLSEEELDMLLSDDWEKQTGEGGPT